MLGLFLGTVSWSYVAFGSMAIAHGLRLGALDSCDASRLSMHVPMCRPHHVFLRRQRLLSPLVKHG